VDVDAGTASSSVQLDIFDSPKCFSLVLENLYVCIVSSSLRGEKPSSFDLDYIGINATQRKQLITPLLDLFTAVDGVAVKRLQCKHLVCTIIS